MAYIPVPNVAQIELRGSLWAQEVENTLMFHKTGGAIDTADLQALALHVEQHWYISASVLLPHAYQFREAYATDLTSAAAPTAVANDHTGFMGTFPSDSSTMPGNVTICATFRTAGRGRASRGRNFWPGIPRNQVSGNGILTPYCISIRNMYAQLLPLGANPPPGWQWVVVSRRLNNAPRPVGTVLPVTEVVFANFVVDSMRRRLPGRGD